MPGSKGGADGGSMQTVAEGSDGELKMIKSFCLMFFLILLFTFINRFLVVVDIIVKWMGDLVRVPKKNVYYI